MINFTVLLLTHNYRVKMSFQESYMWLTFNGVSAIIIFHGP
jgi:hypothetical protein